MYSWMHVSFEFFIEQVRIIVFSSIYDKKIFFYYRKQKLRRPNCLLLKCWSSVWALSSTNVSLLWSCFVVNTAVWRRGAVRRAQRRAYRNAVQLSSGDFLQLLCSQMFVKAKKEKGAECKRCNVFLNKGHIYFFYKICSMKFKSTDFE